MPSVPQPLQVPAAASAVLVAPAPPHEGRRHPGIPLHHHVLVVALGHPGCLRLPLLLIGNRTYVRWSMEATSDTNELSSPAPAPGAQRPATGCSPSPAGYTPLVPMPSRVLLIGWDGADWRILDPLLERGVLPNLAALIDRGGRATLTSTIPTHSWAAWPSFLTGVDPDGHGVYDILEGRGGTKQYPVTYRSIKERTFLVDLTAANVTTAMLNVPLTFPPPQIDGVLIAGGVLPKGRDCTHPPSLQEDLKNAGTPWPING